MFKKIREFNENNTNLYFFVTMFILIGLLFINSLSKDNKDIDNNNTISSIVSSSDIYSYDMKINKPDEVILVSVKRYGNKYLIEKTEKGQVSTYYVYYSDIYEQDSTDKFILFKGNSFVEELDNKLFYMDYIYELSYLGDKVTDDDKTCYDYSKESVNICIDNDNIITLYTGNIAVTYDIDKEDDIEDFNVNISNNTDVSG